MCMCVCVCVSNGDTVICSRNNQFFISTLAQASSVFQTRGAQTLSLPECWQCIAMRIGVVSRNLLYQIHSVCHTTQLYIHFHRNSSIRTVLIISHFTHNIVYFIVQFGSFWHSVMIKGCTILLLPVSHPFQPIPAMHISKHSSILLIALFNLFHF